MASLTVSEMPFFIWLGVGEAKNSDLLDRFLKEYPNGQTVLVEVRSSVLNFLKNKYKNYENFNFVNAAIDITEEEKDFFIFNNEEYSSFKKPADLKSLFPGLVVTGVENKYTSDLGVFIEGLNINREINNHLFIDLPGQALDLVGNLKKNSMLNIFSNIHITTSALDLYELGGSRSDIESILKAEGYDLVRVNQDDPDIPTLSYGINKIRIELQQKIKKIEKKDLELEKRKQDFFAEKNAIHKKLLELLKENNVAFNENSTSVESGNLIDSNIVFSIDEIEKRLISSKEILEKYEKETLFLKDEIKKLLAKVGASEELIVSEKSLRKKEAEDKNKEITRLHSEISRLEDALKHEKAEARELKEQNANVQLQLGEKNTSHILLQKINTKLNLDLEETRNKYQIAKINEVKLASLIKDLRSKLQYAVNFYDFIEKRFPEILKEDVNQKIIADVELPSQEITKVSEIKNRKRKTKKTKKNKCKAGSKK